MEELAPRPVLGDGVTVDRGTALLAWCARRGLPVAVVGAYLCQRNPSSGRRGVSEYLYPDLRGKKRAWRESQQMRGSGSPTSMSTIRVPPNVVRSTTMPGGVEWIRPMSVASVP